MHLRLDPASATPVFQQIIDGVVAAIRAGELAAGQRLPTVRAFAAQLEVANNTVAKAYRHLEEEGHVQTLGRAGTVVRADQAPEGPVSRAVTQLREAAGAAGLDLEETIGLLRRTWR